MDLLTKVATLPSNPGVYRYRNAEGVVIYVGKAKNLRQRVRSYFVNGAQENAKTGSLLREAVDLDYIVVANEAEALALENNLIKQLKPRFNVLLRDDKTYPYIRLSLEPFPRVYVTRKVRKDGSEYFGPYFPASLAYRIVHLIHRSFKVPSCYIDLRRRHARPCLQYHIHRCLGPCVEGLTTPEAYAEAVGHVRLFLSGKHRELLQLIHERRDQAAARERYEEAASWRDLGTVIEDLQERQKMASSSEEDADVVGVHLEQDRAAVNVFHVRRGRVVDRREFFWESLPEETVAGAADGNSPEAADSDRPAGGLQPLVAESSSAELPASERSPAGAAARLLGAVLAQLYVAQPYVPPRVITPVQVEDQGALQQLLSQQRGAKVEFIVPQRGTWRALQQLAQENAQQSFQQRFRVATPSPTAIAEGLQEALELPVAPRRIEMFDISHFQGAETVASMVVWEEGRMKKSDYRKFIIREVEGIDDFRSMREVVTRRYRALKEQQQPMPDLVMVDGGLGQLHAAQSALEELGLTTQPLASLAKREEILYVAGDEEPILLQRHSPVLHLVQMIRDESHRFAISFHRQRRGSRTLRSELLEVPGLGPASVRNLLSHFGSLAAVNQASLEQLREVLSQRQSQALWRHLHADRGAAQTPADPP